MMESTEPEAGDIQNEQSELVKDSDDHVNDSHKGSDELDTSGTFDIICDPCMIDDERMAAVGYCQDCREYLCEACYKVHCRPSVTRHHVLLDATSMPRGRGKAAVKDVCTEQCSKHEHKIIEYYCRSHELLGCSVCMTTRHRACENVDYIPDVAADLDHSDALEKLTQELSEMISEVGIGETKLESNTRAIDINSKIAVSKIKQLRREVDVIFDKLEASMIQEVTDLKVNDERNMSKHAEQLKQIVQKLNDHENDLAENVNSRQFCKLFVSLKGHGANIQLLRDEMEAVFRKLTIRRYEFVPEKRVTDLKDSIREFGELIIKESSVQVAASAGGLLVKCPDDQGTPNISGIQLLTPNSLVAVDSCNKALKHVDITANKVVSKYKLDTDPWDVTKITEARIALTLPNMNSIEFIAVSETGVLEHVKVISVGGNCYGIDFSNGRLYVTFNNPGLVRVLDLEGKVLFTFPQQFGVPWYVVASPCSRLLYVADTGQNVVTAADLEGKVKATFKDTALLGLRGLTADKSGSVYVCGWGSNNIIRITSYCAKEQVLQDAALKLCRPYSATYCDTSERLFIGMSSDQIRVIQFH